MAHLDGLSGKNGKGLSRLSNIFKKKKKIYLVIMGLGFIFFDISEKILEIY